MSILKFQVFQSMKGIMKKYMINTKVMKWKSVKKRRNENQITTTKKIGEPQIMTVLN